MKLSSIVHDKVAPDGRQGAGTRSAGTTDTSSPFDGILSRLDSGQSNPKRTTDPKASRPSPASAPATTPGSNADPSTLARAAQHPADGKDTQTDGAVSDEAQPAAATATTDAAAATPTDVLPAGVVAFAAATDLGATTMPAATKASGKDDVDAVQMVDDILRRVTTKDPKANDSATPAAATSTATDPPIDLIALLVGRAIAGAPTAAAPASGMSKPATTSPSAAVPLGDVPPGGAPLGGKAADTANTGTIVTNVSIETHLATGDSQQTTVANVLAADPAGPVANPKPLDSASSFADNKSQTDDPTRRVSAESQVAAPVPADPVANLAATLDAAPLRRIASAVVALAAAPLARGDIPDTPAKPLLAARTLTLQMQPADLGTVDIRLHISGDALDLQLKVSDSRTLGLVSRERDTLSTMLRDQNYQVHSLVIQDAGAAAFTGGSNAGAGGQASNNGRTDDRQNAFMGQGQGGSREGQNEDRASRNSRRGQDQPAARAPADNSLLVV